jgi:hypothetical protein
MVLYLICLATDPFLRVVTDDHAGRPCSDMAEAMLSIRFSFQKPWLTNNIVSRT